MNRGPQKLGTDTRVAIIGGGPAGSSFALYLLHYCAAQGFRPQITVFAERNVAASGPKGCKGGAGILSPVVLKKLQELGLILPPQIIQAHIEQYIVHSPYISISMSNPEKGAKIVSVYRGCGPRTCGGEMPIGFDGWLLQEAEKRGARIEQQRVTHVYLEGERGIKVSENRLAYDFIVLASGVNTKPVRISGLDYCSPETRVMDEKELIDASGQLGAWLGQRAHVFLLPHSGLVFGGLVPKGFSINVSVLGSGKYPVSVNDFLRHDLVRQTLPGNYRRGCGCRPHAVIRPAHNYFTDGFVAIGDAVVSRLYKDGIGSAFLTAEQAARISATEGTSRQDFKNHYKPFCRRMARDNRWGKLLFGINDWGKDSRTFLKTQHRLIGREQKNTRSQRPFTRAAWGMFTGSYTYRQIAWMVFRPLSLLRLLVAFLWEGFGGSFLKNGTAPRSIHVGEKKVLILGSGFGGTYTLRHLVSAFNRNENVNITMVSNENFFLFSPLLHEAAAGGIEPRHIAYPIRRLHRRDRFQFIQANVTRIDLGAREVFTTAGELGYDYLILALGSIASRPKLESDGTSVLNLKTLKDAVWIRDTISGIFEAAIRETDPEKRRGLLTFVVGGGGYTGIQLITELRDFICRDLLRFYRNLDHRQVRIILVESEPKIIAELHTRLGAYVMKQLIAMGIEVRLRSRITRAWPDRVEINGTEIVPASTLIWTTGILANPVVAELKVPKDYIGRVLVNERLELPGFPEVFGVGDCAFFENPETGRPIPPRAHIALRQARIAARNIVADIRGQGRKPYRYSNTAEMVSLGASKAVFRFHGIQIYGLPARLIWLAGYSLLVTGIYNRCRIIIDWMFSSIFGRDITFLNLKNGN
jgi:NADH dehydrogenase